MPSDKFTMVWILGYSESDADQILQDYHDEDNERLDQQRIEQERIEDYEN